MHLIDFQDKLSFLHNLIEKQITGTPKQFALKLGVSERTVRCYIDQLKQMGAPICYSRSRQTYFYCYRVVFKFGYEKEEGQTVDKEKYGGG